MPTHSQLGSFEKSPSQPNYLLIWLDRCKFNDFHLTLSTDHKNIYHIKIGIKSFLLCCGLLTVFRTILLNMFLFYEDNLSAIYKKWGSENKIIIKLIERGWSNALGRKSRIGHKKCNILLNERKVTNLEIFQHSSYCVHFKFIKVYIFVKVILQGY